MQGSRRLLVPKKELVKIDKDGGYSLIRPVEVLLASEQCVDITVSASTSDSDKAHAVGKVVNIPAEEKVEKNGATCEASGLEFIPFVLNCSGIIHSDAWSLLQRLGFGYSTQTSKPYSQCIAIFVGARLVWRFTLVWLSN